MEITTQNLISKYSVIVNENYYEEKIIFHELICLSSKYLRQPKLQINYLSPPKCFIVVIHQVNLTTFYLVIIKTRFRLTTLLLLKN